MRGTLQAQQIILHSKPKAANDRPPFFVRKNMQLSCNLRKTIKGGVQVAVALFVDSFLQNKREIVKKVQNIHG